METPRVNHLIASTSDCIPAEPSPSLAPSLTHSGDSDDQDEPLSEQPIRQRRASTRLVAQNAADIQRITGESTAQVLGRCCGGGCCMGSAKVPRGNVEYDQLSPPDNDAFRSLNLKINNIPKTLTATAPLPTKTVSFEPLNSTQSLTSSSVSSPTDSAVSFGQERNPQQNHQQQQQQQQQPTTCSSPLQGQFSKMSLADDDTDTTIQPPSFVQPHPPHHVFAARIHNSRELTKPGAEKRTYHFDLDITTYPGEEATDFKVGGAIGVSAPNDTAAVDEVMDLLLIPRFLRDKQVVLRTNCGRWPTVWGEDEARRLITTRRDLLTWCSDIQSYPPTKNLLRTLAEHADNQDERKILLFLCSAEGQGAFCDFRTGPHVSLAQLLHAFPSSHPPLDTLLSVLQPLMPRFYSLSNDPHESFLTRDGKQHRLVEIAVTVHETPEWRGGFRTGVGSGFFERQAQRFIEAQKAGRTTEDLYIPMFKGLMANPLAKQFVSDGPMLLIGAGVGIAPFRGFVQRRLKSANCANKVWVLQGIRDSLLDEIYGGEWGVHEDEVKRVVESRRGEGRYVQEEVYNQADLVWYIINAVDGRVFVCGSTKGMGEGVEESLVEVAMRKGNLDREEAKQYWALKKEVGQYIAETW